MGAFLLGFGLLFWAVWIFTGEAAPLLLAIVGCGGFLGSAVMELHDK